MLAVLLDPENLTDGNTVKIIGQQILLSKPDFVFVGGSTYTASTTPLIETLRRWTREIPVVLFPGHPSQFSDKADAVLFLSLISGNNPDALIGWQVESARAVRDSGIEVLPMGYILVGDSVSSTARITSTMPIPETDIIRITDTAIAGVLLGMRLVYIEGGSGAEHPINTSVIKRVRQEIDCPLIVGGGICTAKQAQEAWQAGADIVVVGNHLEQHAEELNLFCSARHF